ncbi:putative pectinesterase inhibitor domain-containing protein [Medicago truncatula]|uniref:Putative pectinesterase inhibitor domain-containing protein n=1 Tax=Medicago truncatula TaxID=3880 RepID=A0A396HEX9_MEDTR|nr:putative pectinesterase inhibitor domain-containing protein [Medicago truncatula]
MKSTTLSSLFFIFFLCIILYAPLPVISGSLYVSLCNEYRPEKEIPYCLSLLKADSRITLAKNYHDLSKYILEMASRDAFSVKTYLTLLAKRYPSDKAIGECIYLTYATTTGALNSALDKLDNDPHGARDSAITAAFGAADCDKAFQNDTVVHDPAIHIRNNEVFFISVMASLGIIHLF